MEKGESHIKKKVALCTMGAFVLLGFIFGGLQLSWGHPGRAALGFGAVVLPFLVPAVVKRLVGAHPWVLYTMGFLFCILSYDGGSVLLLFDSVPLLDKVAHFLSGFLFTSLGYCLFMLQNRRRLDGPLDNWPTGTAYAVFFSIFVAVVWEIFEFCGYFVIGLDSQHHLDSGVMDTMGDLITCFIGSLLCAASWLLTVKKGKRLLTGAVILDFYEALHPRRN